MRRIIGLLAILLGGGGVLLLAASGIAAWRVQFAVVDRTDRTAARVSERLRQSEAKLRRVEEKVTNLSVDTDAVRKAAERLIARAVKETLAQSELDQLLERFSRLLQQSEEIGETLDIVARIFEDAADLSGQFDGNSGRTARLRDVANSLEQATAALAKIREELAEIQLQAPSPRSQKLTDLAARTRAPLARLADGIAAIRESSAEIQKSLEQLRREVRFWMRTGTALLSFVLVWLGLGQVCMIQWGWKRLRSTRPSIGSH